MKYFLSLLFVLLPILSFSQESSNPRATVKGFVASADSKEGIEMATIKILSPDSSFIQGISASHTGGFTFKHNPGKYILEASMLGYKKGYRNLNLVKDKTVDLDTIFLKMDEIFLDEMQVVAQLPPVQVKGDTIEFNAGAYNTDGSSVLKDLIKQIPGLEMDQNGILKANGKTITKILVDNKEYFGNDINMALSTLPANMINKLQLFEKESEEAKATGIKDEQPEQVLNLDVKEEFKRSVFGDTKSGLGNKGRHTNRFNLNKMHGDNQYSLVGDINNINDSEYSSYSSANFDDNISKSIGANFNIQESEKITINGSARYNNNKARDEYISDSYSSILNQYSDRKGRGINKRQNMDLNTSVDWKPDSLTFIYFSTRMGFGKGNNISNSMDSARIVGKNTTSAHTNRYSENDRINVNNSLMLSRKLNDKGRNVTLNLSQSYGRDTSEGTNYSEKKYWETNETDIIDQRSNNNSKSTSYGISARYIEPIGKENKIYASYQVGFNNGDRIGDVKKIDPVTGDYIIADPDYSRTTESSSIRQSVRLGFQHTKEKYNFGANFSIDPSLTRNKTIFIDKEPEDLKQNVINYSPSLRFSWQAKKDSYVDFNYYGSTNHPSITQLSSDIIIHSATNQTQGNPNLKPSFNNNINLSYRKSDFESGRYFSSSLSYSYTFNSVIPFQKVDEHSNTYNSYRNIDGNSSAYAYVSFNTPLKNKKFNIGVNLNSSFNKNISYINEQKNIQDSYGLSPSIFGRFNSDKVETNLNVYVNHYISKNNLAEIKRSNHTSYRVSNYLKINLPLDFSIESNLDFSYRSGLGDNIKKDETMWNLAVAKLFLKEKRGTLKFEFFDVLNDLRQQENTVSGSDYSNYWRKEINNYFILSFSYRFNFLQ